MGSAVERTVPGPDQTGHEAWNDQEGMRPLHAQRADRQADAEIAAAHQAEADSVDTVG